MPGHLEQLQRLVVDRDAGLSTFLRDRGRNAAVQVPGIPMGDSAASSRRAEDLSVVRGRRCLTMCHWRKRRSSAPFVPNVVFITRVCREYPAQALPTPVPQSRAICWREVKCVRRWARPWRRRKGTPIQLLAARISFWPLRWMMFNTSQSYVGSERDGRDLRQRLLLRRRNRPLVRAKSIAMWFLSGGDVAHTAARERRRPQLRIKRPARRSPRASPPGIGQSGYLRQSGPIQARWDERPAKLDFIRQCSSSASSCPRDREAGWTGGDLAGRLTMRFRV